MTPACSAGRFWACACCSRAWRPPATPTPDPVGHRHPRRGPRRPLRRGRARPPALAGLNPFRPADAFYEIYPEDLALALTRLAPDLVIAGWGVPGAVRAARAHGIPVLWHGFGRMVPEGTGLESPLAAAPA
ncbi:hypothetical protein ACFQV2_31815 [Actinokineospora soli]|uniref:Uncharacterized protein n=1 Tax=Actinokineospora soli TaxID=1048753 RepID=A0ABW2TX05_9PSEU